MRLTLRTLLAWMDGVLPPAVAAELAAKVAASPAAHSLADRIRGLRDRAGRTRPLDGPDLAADINAVAEYLDNALDPGMLADFERDCLASDARLAEVAVCHRLLAGYAATAAPPPPAPRDPAAVGPIRQRPAAPPASTRPATTGGNRSLPWASWLLATVATLLLLVLAGLFGWSVIRDRGRRGPPPPDAIAAQQAAVRFEQPPAPVEHRPADPAMEPRRAAGEPRAVDRADAAADDSGPPTAAELRQPTPAAPEIAPTDPADPAAPPQDSPLDQAVAEPAAAPRESLAVDVRVPFGDALAIVGPRSPAAIVPVTPPPADGAVAPAVAASPADAARIPLEVDPWAENPPAASAQARLVAGPPVLYLPPGLDDATARWRAAVAGRPFPLPADVVAIGPGTVIALGEGLELRLRPGSRVGLTAPTAPGAPAAASAPTAVRIELRFGGMTIAGQGDVAVTAGDLAGIATLGPGAPLGVELDLSLPRGADPAVATAVRDVRLFSALAPVGWRQPAAAEGPPEPPLTGLPADAALPPRSRLSWSDHDPAAVAVEAATAVPPWVTGGWPADRLDRAVADEFTAKFAAGFPARHAEDLPAAAMLQELAGSPREEVRAAAAAAAATLGDYRPLVRLLSGETPRDMLREGRWQQLETATVPLALARGPAAAAAVAASFVSDGPAGRAADLVRLARGFTAEELDAGAAAWLVLALDDPRLVIRRYAIKNLLEIAPVERADRLRYRADRDAGLRKEGVAWWRARLEQGLVGRQTTITPPRP